MQVTIRRTKNFQLIREMDLELFGDAVAKPSEKAVWWLAHVDGQIAGYAGLTLYPEHDYGFLHRAGVLPAFRGNGLQRRMIAVRKARARSEGLAQLLTYTAGWNHASSNNLIRSGFKLYSPKEDFGCKGALYWMLEL